MLKKFEEFNNDPYGEEDWEDKPDPRLKFKVGDKVYCNTDDNIYWISRAYVSQHDEKLYDINNGRGKIGEGFFESEFSHCGEPISLEEARRKKLNK